MCKNNIWVINRALQTHCNSRVPIDVKHEEVAKLQNYQCPHSHTCPVALLFPLTFVPDNI